MKTVQRPGLGPQATLGGGDGSGRALRVSGETRSRASPGPAVGEAVQEERPDRRACQKAKKGKAGGESEIGFIPGEAPGDLDRAVWGPQRVWVAQRPDCHTSSQSKERGGTGDSETVLLGSLDKIEGEKMGRGVGSRESFLLQ